jgi:hypothetical protein
MPAETDLPYVDEHAIRIAAPREQVWAVLERHVGAGLGVPEGHLLARILGTQPQNGFAVAKSEAPERLTLAGRHRFSRYQLRFELAEAPNRSTQLRAQTYAEFPGVHGRIYRALVIDSRLHVIATNRILRSVRRRCTGA